MTRVGVDVFVGRGVLEGVNDGRGVQEGRGVNVIVLVAEGVTLGGSVMVTKTTVLVGVTGAGGRVR